MKPTVIKSIMLPLFNHHLLLMGLIIEFIRLAQMEQRNGPLNLDYLHQPWNHSGLLTIFLVLEDHEMTC